MASTGLTKRAMIDKTNTRIVIMVSVAVFVTIFSLVATKTLFSQFNYQNRVLGKKNVAVRQLENNVENSTQLKSSYDAFTGTVTNVLKGNSTGVGPKDGDNAKITLDALPSYYDFPATVTSLMTLTQGNVSAANITGTDNEVQEAGNRLSASPEAIEIPFQLTAEGTYPQVQALLDALKKSIRPIKINTLDVSGQDNKLTVSVSGSTYYQPGKSLTVKTEVVK